MELSQSRSKSVVFIVTKHRRRRGPYSITRNGQSPLGRKPGFPDGEDATKCPPFSSSCTIFILSYPSLHCDRLRRPDIRIRSCRLPMVVRRQGPVDSTTLTLLNNLPNVKSTMSPPPRQYVLDHSCLLSGIDRININRRNLCEHPNPHSTLSRTTLRDQPSTGHTLILTLILILKLLQLSRLRRDHLGKREISRLQAPPTDLHLLRLTTSSRASKLA